MLDADRDNLESLNRLLLERPAAWEYLYFAGVLRAGFERLDPKYRAHESRYAPLSDVHLDDSSVVDAMQRATTEMLAIIAALVSVMDRDAQVHAFGAPGEPGDADQIAQLANRWNSCYENMLDWATRYRSATVPDRYRRALDLLWHMADQPIEEYRAFVRELIERFDRLPADIATGAPVVITLNFTISMDDAVVKALEEEIALLGESTDDLTFSNEDAVVELIDEIAWLAESKDDL